MRKLLTQKPNVLFVGLLAFAAALRFYHCDYQSVWVDEINTLVQANPKLTAAETYEALLKFDLQPPLYFYLLKYLFCVFGYTPLVMRTFSAALGVAGVGAIFLLGRELAGRRAGFIAAIILCVNFFHIHYSQEGRPYAFLILFTCLSFYRFSIFLRDPKRTRNAVWLGVCSALMLYGHPIALFALFSQYLLLAWFFVQKPELRAAYLRKGLLMTFILVLVYIPALPLLYSASGVKSFWIELPWNGLFAFTLSQFFGGAETVLAIVYLLIAFFFICAFRWVEKPGEEPPTEERAPASQSFLVLTTWLLCCILIPLIRSHLSVPMIIPRYLNIVLPAVVLLLASAIACINSSAVRYTLLGCFTLFSLTDLFVIKDYYWRPTKTDFRGITNYVEQRIQPDDQIASRIGWHYAYLFENTQPPYPVLWNTFQAYVETAMKWPQNFRHGFWFVDAQAAPLSLTQDAASYLNTHYVMDYRKDLYQTVGIHYRYKDSSYHQLEFPGHPEISGSSGGSLSLTEQVPLVSAPLDLAPGSYTLLISAGGQPDTYLNGLGSHLQVSLNNRHLGGAFLKEAETVSAVTLRFQLPVQQQCKFSIAFDNPYAEGERRRQATLYTAHVIGAPLITSRLQSK